MRYLSIVILIISTVILLKVFTLNFYPDFRVYYFSTTAFLKGQNPYLPSNRGMSYLYTPPTLLFFIPFIIFPILTAEKIWAVISLFSVILSFALLIKLFQKKIDVFEASFLLSLLFISFPLKFTLGMGQINSLVLLLITLSLYFYKKSDYLKSSLFLILSIISKLFPVILLLYFVLIKDKKYLLYSLLSFSFVILLSILFIKPQIYNYYLSNVLTGLSGSLPKDYYNQALSGFLLRHFQDQTAVILRYVIASIMLLLTTIVIFNKKQKNKIFEISIYISLALIINQFSWQHHFLILLIPFLATYFFIKNKKLNIKYYLILLISYFLVAVNLKNPTDLWIIIQSHVFFGIFLLWLTQLYLLKHE